MQTKKHTNYRQTSQKGLSSKLDTLTCFAALAVQERVFLRVVPQTGAEMHSTIRH